MMAKHTKRRRFRYSVDVSDPASGWGVWGVKEYDDRNQALSYAESLAESNRQVDVSVNVVPKDRSQVPRSLR
jgi:hypothetical protein